MAPSSCWLAFFLQVNKSHVDDTGGLWLAPTPVVCFIIGQKNTRFRVSVTFRTRSKPDICPGGDFTSLLKLVCCKHNSEIAPGKEHHGLPILGAYPERLAYLEKAMETHSSTLAWKIPCAEEPGGLKSMGSQRPDWVTSLSLFTFMHWRRKWQPTPVSLPGESHGRQSLVGCRLWGRTESDTTEAT